MNIKLVKLVCGEELLCEFKEGERHSVMENPMVIMPVQTEDGISIGMAPWMPAAKERKFKINSKDHIITIADPATELANQYNSAFGSGIVIPDVTPTGISM